MRGCIFIFKHRALLLIVSLGLFSLQMPGARADGDVTAPPPSNPDGKTQDKTLQPEEDDFSETPFTEYGEFNEEEAEAADTKFLQYGRLFGISLGLGFETISGNRALLYQGNFPVVNFRLHYWFDFNFAMDLGFYTSSHFYTDPSSNDHHDVNFLHFGLDFKYYIDTKNLAAPISFANPYLLVGAGSFTETDSSLNTTTNTSTSLGLNLGGGVEFALKPRKVYFAVEGQVHIVTYQDTYTTLYTNYNIPDLTGLFYTLTGNFLFTY
jgi:hypothetical protein